MCTFINNLKGIQMSVENVKLVSRWFQTFALFRMLYAFFWVIPRRLNFICRRFGTLCLYHIYRRPWRWNRQSVPKRRHIQFIWRGITPKEIITSWSFLCKWCQKARFQVRSMKSLNHKALWHCFLNHMCLVMPCWRLVPNASTLHHLFSDFFNVNELAVSGLSPVLPVPFFPSSSWFSAYLGYPHPRYFDAAGN